ncbi:hypothetical protein DL93DRAFT_1214114 [Clavulina sp. PMI_390]|nr:hypothetical protein DL93DRAFT_1214114 [Clavulina sp. PMI_390]
MVTRDDEARLWRSPILAVCHRWRQCAVRFPTLWAQVYVEKSTSFDELTTWLRRSEPLSLDVTIRHLVDAEHFKAVMVWIGGRDSRIGTLFLNVPEIAPSSIFPFKCPNSVQTLNIRWGQTGDQSPLLLFSGNSPSSLTRLGLQSHSGAASAVVTLNVTNPEQCTELVLQGVTPESVAKTLPLCTALEELGWIHHTSDVLVAPKFTHHILPRLSRLYTNGIIPATLLKTPGLTLSSLQLNNPQLEANELIEFCKQQSNLDTLILNQVKLGEEHLNELFAALPVLGTLAYYPWGRKAFPALRALTYPFEEQLSSAPAWRCPQLRQLAISTVNTQKQQGPRNTAFMDEIKALAPHIRSLLSIRGAKSQAPITLLLDHSTEMEAELGSPSLGKDIRWMHGDSDWPGY